MVNLNITIGTVNYTDYLHVTVCKVKTPSVIAWETWIAMPVSSYNLVVPGLDPEDYYINYYEAPDNTSLGTLQAQLIVKAASNQILSERRFYTCGGAGAYDPIDGADSITDPYFVGKNVTGIFKEAFRYFEPVTEYTFDNVAGTVAVINGTKFTTDEKVAIEISYNNDSTNAGASSSGGLYTGSITVAEATRTLTTGEIDARVRLLGTISTQVITLPPLSSIATNKGYYFDNSVGGVAVQSKILFNGADKLLFNGFNTADNLFTEFWVSKGEHLLIRKGESGNWEVMNDYKGTNVGEKVTLGYNGHPNILVEQGQLIDGDEYPRLYWWVKNVLPSTHKYVDDTVVNDPFTGFDVNRSGQFAIHSALKKFRMPYTVYLTERGISNFLNPGTDSQRTVAYPGGWQEEQIGEHTHTDIYGDTGGHGSSSTSLSGIFKWLVNGITSGSNTGKVSGGRTGPVTKPAGTSNENRTRNNGVVYARRI
jgi:hypothetical protein